MLNEDYLNTIWTTEHQGPIAVKDMKRSHVRNCLQWVLRRESGSSMGTELDDMLQDSKYWNRDKDGLYYRDWVEIFTARLLDPELAE